MKKLITFTLAIFVTVGLLSGCAQDNTEDISRISELEAQVGSLEDSMSALESEKEELDSKLSGAESEIDSLTEENKRLTDELSEADSENETLKEQLEQDKAALKEVHIEHLRSGKKLFFTYRLHAPTDSHAVLTLRREDGSETEIYSSYHELSSYDISPNDSKIVATNFSVEGPSYSFWYDIETETLTDISNDGLPANNGASDFVWLDERYFLFISQFDHGSLSLGGEVYVYDTQTNTYRLLIKNESLIQITSLQIDSYAHGQRDIVFFRAVVWDNTLNYTTQKSFTVSIEKLKEMIVDGEAMTYDGEMLSRLD